MSIINDGISACEQISISSKCAVCGDVGEWNRCGGCLLVAYCSKAHQKCHWRAHKSQCSPIKVAISSERGRHYIAARKLKAGEVVIKEDPILKFPSLESNPGICLGCYSPIRTIDPKDSTDDRAVTPVNRDTSASSPETVEPPRLAHSSSCSRCGWPVCSRRCEISVEHSNECLFLRQFRKIDDSSNESITNMGTPFGTQAEGRFGKLVAVVRALALTHNSDRNAWEALIDLESHLEEREDEEAEFWQAQRWIHEFVSSSLDLQSLETATNTIVSARTLPDLVARILGAVEVNCFQLSNADVFGIYPRAAIMEHSCYPNVEKVFDACGRIYLRVLRPVERGEQLAHCYAEPLWGKLSRRIHLRRTHFFDCDCPRCEDPTELGTHFNAIKCPICLVGYVEPVTTTPSSRICCLEQGIGKEDEPTTTTARWQCTLEDCPSYKSGQQQDSSLLEDVSSTILEELKALDKFDIRSFETFLEKYSPVLHPNHHCAIEAVRVLSQLYGNVMPGTAHEGTNNNDRSQRHQDQEQNKEGSCCATMENLSAGELKRKEHHCRRVLSVLDILMPGSSRLKGATLFELQASLRYQVLLDMDIKHCLRILEESSKMAEECIAIMDVKIPGSAESAISEAAKRELQTINLHVFHAKVIAGSID